MSAAAASSFANLFAEKGISSITSNLLSIYLLFLILG